MPPQAHIRRRGQDHFRQSASCRSGGDASRPEGSAAAADARRDRRRVRRYRHLAALHDEGKLPRPASAGGRPAAHLRRAEPDLLVADADRDGQICARRDARRQQGRRRLVRAAVADRAQPRRQEMDLGAGHARRARHLPVLRRRDDHPGDLGPVRGRGAGDGQRRLHAVRHSRLDRHPDRPVPRPGARDRKGGHVVRPGHPDLSRGARAARRVEHPQAPRHLRRAQSRLGTALLPLRPQARVPRPRVGVPRGHRARRRSTPTWAISAAGRSAFRG